MRPHDRWPGGTLGVFVRVHLTIDDQACTRCTPKARARGDAAERTRTTRWLLLRAVGLSSVDGSKLTRERTVPGSYVVVPVLQGGGEHVDRTRREARRSVARPVRARHRERDAPGDVSSSRFLRARGRRAGGTDVGDRAGMRALPPGQRTSARVDARARHASPQIELRPRLKSSDGETNISINFDRPRMALGFIGTYRASSA